MVHRLCINCSDLLKHQQVWKCHSIKTEFFIYFDNIILYKSYEYKDKSSDTTCLFKKRVKKIGGFKPSKLRCGTVSVLYYLWTYKN